ncbi:unnamed protein product [Phytophthora lilii]|uniref:Unnamed protein product n=1 Tax=Phytophthora lilii TaxID=2077276 RepID=A0A9W7CKS3_9STRA|nr:unnamed protein product [Phytophthora lilii]
MRVVHRHETLTLDDPLLAQDNSALVSDDVLRKTGRLTAAIADRAWPSCSSATRPVLRQRTPPHAGIRQRYSPTFWTLQPEAYTTLASRLFGLCAGFLGAERRVEEFAYELKLPDRSGYKFYPVVHVSRLNAVNEFEDRPRTQLAPGVTEKARFDFDEELLPEDSWEPDRLAGEYEVECILDDRTPLSTGTGRAVREFKDKWVGYGEPTWEPAANLSCGGLLYDYFRAKRQDQRLQMVQVAERTDRGVKLKWNCARARCDSR